MAGNKVYTESLVAFLDILGFSDAILETETNQSAIRYLSGMLNDVQRAVEAINTRAKKSWKIVFNAQAFSDSIVISCKTISHKSFIFMSHLIAGLQMIAIEHEFLLRGAISAGGHYDENGVCFGPAFVRAYKMEKQNLWPRVIIDPLVLQKLGSKVVNIALESYLLRDYDGLCYFNYLHLSQVVRGLRIMEGHIGVKEIPNFFVANLKQHKECLLAMVERVKARGQPDLLPKYHAVATYHNQYVEESYKYLPSTLDFKQVDPETPTGRILRIFRDRDIVSSGRKVPNKDIELKVKVYIKLMREQRRLFKAQVIDLESIFAPLYTDRRGLAKD